jgi:hypothetical protein
LARELFDYDPDTGVVEWFEFDEATGLAMITREQDLTAFVDQARRQAVEGVNDAGIKNGFWHYATIPDAVAAEFTEQGININDPDDVARVIAKVNRDYPYLKVTELTHE